MPTTFINVATLVKCAGLRVYNGRPRDTGVAAISKLTPLPLTMRTAETF
jgi:hypothetical protein